MIVLLVIETDLSWLWSIHSTQYTSYNPHLAWLRLASTEDSRSTHQHTLLPSITQQRLTGGRGGNQTGGKTNNWTFSLAEICEREKKIQKFSFSKKHDDIQKLVFRKCVRNFCETIFVRQLQGQPHTRTRENRLWLHCPKRNHFSAIEHELKRGKCDTKRNISSFSSTSHVISQKSTVFLRFVISR